MFGLTYISTDRKRQLRKLQEKLTSAVDNKARNEINLLIQEIMAEAMPYLKCDKYQLSELKNQLLDNVATLQNLGKAEAVESFQVYLKEVDFRLQTLQMEETLKEKERPVREEGSNLKDRSVTQNSLKKDRVQRKKEARGHTRWVIGMDEE